MPYCSNCGKKINDNSAFCCFCGKAVAGYSQNQSEQQPQNAQHKMYEEFSPKWGIGGKHFAFTENSLVHGYNEYPYSQFRQIRLTNVPTNSLMNGTASALLANGKTLLLAFSFDQKDRFIKAMNYANEKIDSANGTSKNFKFLLQSYNGSKLEIYDEYLRLYYIPLGMKNTFSNTMRSGSIETTMYFKDIAVQLSDISDSGEFNFIIDHNGDNYSIPLKAENLTLAQDAVSYIMKAKESDNTGMQEPKKMHETWKAEKGFEKSFPICGQELKIPQNLDIFNSYRLRFRTLAFECADCARTEFRKKVRDLTTYLEFFPNIYNHYLAAMCEKAMEITVAEGIWTVTASSFLENHKNNFHLVFDDIKITADSVRLTIEKNQKTFSNAMSYIPNLRGGGFGLKGAAKGIATATAFNVARDSIESGLVKGAANINQAQQMELYNRIKQDILFEHVFIDYWRVFLSLVATLRNNGKNIWWPSDESTQKASNIFSNLSNPNFPKAQLLDVFLSILQINPYNKEYYKFMVSYFGETDEVIAIKNYFGYTDFENPRIY